MNDIIIGNVCSLCAAVTDSISGAQKKRNRILAFQTLSQVFYGVGTIILKGYSSTAQNAVAVFRNLAAMKNVKSKVLEWSLILGRLVVKFQVFRSELCVPTTLSRNREKSAKSSYVGIT